MSIVDSVEVVRSWESGLEDLFAVFAGRFSRVEPRRRAFAYVRGLLSGLERKNGWTLAEQAGDRSPNALQEMLYSPCWDPDAVRDDLREYVVEWLGEPDAVLAADETGFVKKGVRSEGERLCRTLGTNSPGRGHRPDPHHRDVAPARGPG